MDLLRKIDSNFINKVHYAYEDKQYSYVVLDLLEGRDLNQFCGSDFKLNEQQIKFIGACIIQGLEDLHSNNIIH